MEDLGVELRQNCHTLVITQKLTRTHTAAVRKETDLFTKVEELAEVPSVVIFGWPPVASVVRFNLGRGVWSASANLWCAVTFKSKLLNIK